MSMGADEPRRAPWGARLLALVAFAGAATVLILVVAASLEGSDEEAEELPRERTGRIEGCKPTEREALRLGYYVVQPGEPGLSAVSDKTCVTLERLERLNENLDPQLIPQDACVNLKPEGCKALAEG